MNTLRVMCNDGVLPLIKDYLKFLIETGGSSTRFIMQRIADTLDPRTQNQFGSLSKESQGGGDTNMDYMKYIKLSTAGNKVGSKSKSYNNETDKVISERAKEAKEVQKRVFKIIK